MPIRRRRNIRAYVKIGIGIVVFLFFVSLIQFMGQIDTPGESPRHRHYHRHEESEAKGINAEKNIDDERLNRLRDRVVASGFKSNNDRGDANAGQDSDMNFYEFKRTMTSLQKLVHLDLKGSPPKLAYLKEFLPFAKSAGATGVIIEYEDFFPYKNDLEAVANQNHYTPNELKQLFDLLKENKMSVIPLVQTYGHLEFVLKLKQFAYLREASEHFQVISPCLNDTYEKVVFRMIDQILDAHPTDIEYIHIGCDEVYHVNVNEACKSMTNLKNIHDFFIFHVNKIVDYIKLKRPDLRVMIWEDMIRKNMLSQVDDDLSKLARKIVPVVWNYRENVEISEDVFKKYDNLFAEIWIASAFKGATRQLEIIPNAKLHYNNHLSWLNVIKNFPSPHKIKGIALTGWSRYDHMQSICEILPAAIPSLVLCLQTLINYEHSDLFIYSKTKDLTKCTYNKSSTGFILDPTTALTSRLSYNVDDVLNLYTCEFPGAKLYNWLLSLKLVVQFAMSRHERFSDILNPYNLKYKFLNTMAFEEAKKFYAEFDEKLKYLRSIGEKEFDKFFYADLYDELTNVYIVRYVELIESRIAELNKTILPDSAPIRPFDKIQNQLQYVA